MKNRIVLVLLIIYSLTALELFGQERQKMPVDGKTGLITYKEVNYSEGDRSELYRRCHEWVNEHYVNPTGVTSIRDPENGIIEIKHRFQLRNPDDAKDVVGTVLYVLRIEMKEGRFRYIMTDFTLKQISRFPVERWLDNTDSDYNASWDKYLEQVDAFAQSTLASLKQGMAPPVPEKEDEW